ncbi:MAG: hypothetical protein AB1813_11520 [Verrucomicrobiota bacterium]
MKLSKTTLIGAFEYIGRYNRWRAFPAVAAALLTSATLTAAPVTVFTENFDGFTDAAVDLADTANANPTGAAFTISDDNPAGGTAGSGIQVAKWLAKSGAQSLLVRSGSEAIVQLHNARSGARIQLDFDLYVAKEAGDRNFYVIVRAMGNDTNGEDFMAYRSDRATGGGMFYYDGIAPGTGWQRLFVDHIEQQWQHHRFVFNMANLTFDLFIDDMTTPVVQGGEISRSGAAVPTAIIIRHEGNSADDGYFAIDDLTLAVDEARDLAAPFTEGFESYPAAGVGSLDDVNPQGPWITNEADGTGDAKPLNLVKVQVVDKTVVPPRSGDKSLKLEGGQRAGVSFAWGQTPQSDVQITWWARVPASVDGTQGNYLRMSLYGVEAGRADQGDSALLGYGSRDANVGDETSLTIFTTAWQDTAVDYTPDVWEEYRLTTHVSQGTYTIIKNPSSSTPEVVADRAPFIGTAQNWGPMFMLGFSSSNGTGHPPVYVDDIQVRSLVSNPDPLPDPYTIQIESDRFKKSLELKTSGPVGDVAVDPRDNSTIYFAVDAAGGSILRANKVSAGTWEIEATPIVTGLDRPSGLAIDADGTLWWTHDFTQRLMRLKSPYASNTPEVVIENFGSADTDDDPIDLTIAPANFNGALGNANMVIVADRGSDGDANNALYLVDRATTDLNQLTYTAFLVFPTATDLGGGNLNAIAPLPQSGEVVTISADGFIMAINGDGFYRQIFPTTLFADPFTPISPRAVAVDPNTGRIWVADDILDQVWSVSSTGMEVDRLELSFPLKDANRPDKQIQFHDPGMTFAANGSFLVLSDTSVANGGGRLLIFHNEEPQPIQPFSVSQITRTAQGVELQWQSAGPAKYRVQRSTSVGAGANFQDISGELTTTSFTDTNPPVGNAFYRIVAQP